VFNNKHNSNTASIISTHCCNAILDVILGLEKRRENVWGWIRVQALQQQSQQHALLLILFWQKCLDSVQSLYQKTVQINPSTHWIPNRWKKGLTDPPHGVKERNSLFEISESRTTTTTQLRTLEHAGSQAKSRHLPSGELELGQVGNALSEKLSWLGQ
jgi:hypothetical protein